MNKEPIRPDAEMRQILEALPGAQRALFRLYHIGGCSSCGFRPDETLAEVCARNGGLDPAEVIARVTEEAERESQMLVAPEDLAEELKHPPVPALVDIRTKEEFDAVSIPGSMRLDQELMREMLGSWPKDTPVVLIDHLGLRALDAAAYLAGHGMSNLRALRGGIDAWSQTVDPALPRYTLE